MRQGFFFKPGIGWRAYRNRQSREWAKTLREAVGSLSEMQKSFSVGVIE
jgi:hypothetical protein